MAFARSVGPFVLVVSFALAARADIFSYELVGIAGRNNIIDSNPGSCDSVEGCYSRTGARCSDDPNQLCDLQIVPAGRCTYGSLAGPLNCVWPHGAGHCSGNSKVGCLTDDQCADAGGTCLLTTDPFNSAYEPVLCTCQGTDPGLPAYEAAVCGGATGVCSDGDPMRDEGGLGSAIGEELNTSGPGGEIFQRLGPAVTGSENPDSTPAYAIENLPSAFDPQRDAGTIGRGPGGPIHQARTTEAREILPYAHPTIATPVDVRKMKHLGDSYWSDWTFERFETTTTFNTHTVTLSCDPLVGWVVGTPITGSSHCHERGRNGISFLWGSALTPSQLTAYTDGGQRICPPNCNKDFHLATAEFQELAEIAVQDPNTAIQVALQSGEEGVGRQAGAGDAIGVTRIVVGRFIIDGDLRCRMGGWGNASGYVGRCFDGASACAPDAVNCGMGGACCAGQGSICRACNGPFDASTNPLGLPIGYNTHGRPELDLVAGQRIGGIAGHGLDVKIPLFLIETTGNTTAEFRDIANQGGVPDNDPAEMGPVDPVSGFASGIGSGGTFAAGVELNIDEPCTDPGTGGVTWDTAQLGSALPPGPPYFDFFYMYGPGPNDVYVSDWALTYDKGPGPDGIPGCIGDNHELQMNGMNACRQRLGVGPMGAQTDPFFATGKDDRTILYAVGAATRPASAPRFSWGASSAAVAAYFGGVQNPPIVNTIASFAQRDLQVFLPRSTDLLAKVNTTACPLTNAGPQCDIVVDPCANLGGDTDIDGVCDANDNCSSIANPGQEDGGNGLESPLDGVGDACDSCTTASNPRVAPDYLALNAWATLTGGQRDDDHDGYGNKCDAKFGGLPSQAVGGQDLAQFRASNTEDRRFDTCGTINTRPCAIFDLDEIGNSIGGLDLGRFRQLNAATPGPRCAACTGTGSVLLPCIAGTAGTCF